MRYIKRVSKVKNDDTKGYIINSTNVVDKEKNTYSANIIDGLVTNSTGWKVINDSDGNAVAYYRKTGKIVEVRLGIWSETADYIVPAYHKRTLGTLPEDCRPSFTITVNPFIVPADRTKQPVVHFRVNEGGEIIIENWYTEVKCVYISSFISYVV